MSKKEKHDEDELPIHWEKVQSAIWLIGLAILFWQDWFWPGILVLVAISGLSQAAIQWYLNKSEREERMQQARITGLPSNCPNCGGAVNAASVEWTSDTTAHCPYCSSNLQITFNTE